MKRTVCLFASALLASALPWAYGQAGNQADLQQKLNSAFKITTMAANHSDIDSPGDVVELHKDGMRLSALTTILTESNTYKDGKIGGGAGKRAWGAFGTIMAAAAVASVDPTGTATVPDGPPPRILATGDKCWILSITAQKDGVVFKLLTDPDDNGLRYHGDLKVVFPNKKQMPTPDAALQLIAEVLSVVQPEQPAPEPAPEVVTPPAPPARQYDELAPPPPPPAPTVTIGENRTQVITDFGQPQKKTVVGAKTQYFYTDLKMTVTFINGTVSSID
ncbi:MAG: hypothetical protein ABSC77_01915 [Terracidiphilus sp.]|jgi:hypothetical protein